MPINVILVSHLTRRVNKLLSKFTWIGTRFFDASIDNGYICIWIESLNHLWFQSTWAVKRFRKKVGLGAIMSSGYSQVYIFKEVENPLENHFVKVFLRIFLKCCFNIHARNSLYLSFDFKMLCVLRMLTMVTAANKLFISVSPVWNMSFLCESVCAFV